MYSDDDLLALSGLQHMAFCERQWGLIHLDQIWLESIDTVRGEYFHERVDTVGYECASGVRSDRRVSLVSYSLGIYGIADIVETPVEDSCKWIRPVEYKVGKPKLENWDRIQLTAQAMCLEEMTGEAVTEGALFYGETRRRELVEITDSLRREVVVLSSKMHDVFESSLTPVVQLKSRCKRCSLADYCMPEIFNNDVSSYWDGANESWGDR